MQRRFSARHPAPDRRSAGNGALRARATASAAFLFWLITLPPAWAAEAPAPWSYLEEVRDRLAAAGPLAADFVQHYLPAGFSSGEQESGRLFIALPDCLRWDYRDPYPKSFLLCGELVYSWTPGDRVGRQAVVAAEEEPGLDLLLLSVVRLRERYAARSRLVEGDRVEILLTPSGGSEGFAEATLTIDREAGRPVHLAYRDREGNLTRFELSGYEPLERPTVFSPPAGVEWESE